MRTLFIIYFTFLCFFSFSQQACDKRYCSPNGSAISPHAKIRILTIFINILYDKTPLYDNTSPGPTAAWLPGDPEVLNSAPPSYLPDFLDVDIPPGNSPKGMMTRKYYESSFGRLVLLGDYMVVNLPESEIGTRSSREPGKLELVNAAIDKINRMGGVKTVYGHNSRADYDQAEIDFSMNGMKKMTKPDGQIDLVQFFIRNPGHFYTDIKTGTGYTTYQPHRSGYKRLKFDSLQPPAACYVIMGIGEEDISKNPNSVYMHEFAHLLLGGNGFHTSGGHTYNTNDCSWFMGLQGGYGLMGVDNAGLTSCNAYERWRLGWTSETYNPAAIPIAALDGKSKKTAVSDVSRETGGVSFILRDFVSSGDAIRIRLPYVDSGAVNQYLWLENHQVGKNNKIDYLVSSCFSKNRSRGAAGIYAYMQLGKDILHSNTIEEVYPEDQADNLRVISAEGFFDYEVANTTFLTCGEQNTLGYIHKKKLPNPFCGYSDQENKYFAEGDTLSWQKFQVTHGILEDTVSLTLPYLGDPGDAFSGSVKIGQGTNPSTVPMITFNNFRTRQKKWKKVTDNRTVYLSGLSIVITDAKDGAMRVEINWNDYVIKNDVRWTGNIVLKEKLELEAGKTIRLDQNYTPVQNTRNKNSGYFSSPTEMKAEPGSVIYMEKNSKLIIDNKSILKIEQGSKWIMEKGVEITVQNGGRLIIDQNAVINAKEKVMINVDDKSEVVTTSDQINLIIHQVE